MCLILFAFKAHPVYKLILAANRDEFYNRPTQPAGWWQDTPFLLAGKDLKVGGTWLGVTKDGKVAAITNYRSKDSHKEDALSRGMLVHDYLTDKIPNDEFIEWLPVNGYKYNGFNLIFGDTDNLYYFSDRQNRQGYGNNQKFLEVSEPFYKKVLTRRRQRKVKTTAGVNQLQPGIYGISNAFLDTPWPKVLKGKQMLEQQVLNRGNISIESIFSLLEDTESFPDDKLPDTGIGIEYERILSPLFIKTEGYGTRSSTVILIDNNNRATFKEKSFVPPQETCQKFTISL